MNYLSTPWFILCRVADENREESTHKNSILGHVFHNSDLFLIVFTFPVFLEKDRKALLSWRLESVAVSEDAELSLDHLLDRKQSTRFLILNRSCLILDK